MISFGIFVWYLFERRVRFVVQGGCLSLVGATVSVEPNTEGVKVTLTETQRVFAYKRSHFMSSDVDGASYSNLRFLWTTAARKKWYKASGSAPDDSLVPTLQGSTASYSYV